MKYVTVYITTNNYVCFDMEDVCTMEQQGNEMLVNLYGERDLLYITIPQGCYATIMFSVGPKSNLWTRK